MRAIDEAMNKIRAVLEEHIDNNKPAPKTVRLVWLKSEFLETPGSGHYVSWPVPGRPMFREVMPEERPVTREALAKAWEFVDNTPIAAPLRFKEFCHVLGFKEPV